MSHPFRFLHRLPVWTLSSPTEKRTLSLSYAQYALTAISSQDCHAKINEVCVAHGQKLVGLASLHKSVRYNGDLLKDFKSAVFALWSVYQGTTVPFELPKATQAYVKLTVADPATDEFLRECWDYGCRPLTPTGMDARMLGALESSDFNTYLRKFIYRKMRFILDSYAVTEEQIISDLKSSAIFNMLRVYPHWRNPGHLIAISKVAARNRGHNFIKEMATTSRNRLIKNTDGTHSAALMSLAPEVAASLTGSEVPAASLNGSMTPQGELDLRHSLLQAVNHLEGWQKSFIEVSIGIPNKAFSEYLGGDNEELVHSLDFVDYTTAAANFFGISQRQVLSLYSELRQNALS